MSDIENCKGNLPIDTLERIANQLHVEPYKLIKNEQKKLSRITFFNTYVIINIYSRVIKMTREELKKFQKEKLAEQKMKTYKARKKILIITPIILIIIIGIGYFYSLQNIVIISIGAAITFISLISYAAVGSQLINEDYKTFNKEFKRLYVVDALKKVFKNVKYTPEYGFTKEEVRKNGALYTGDRFYSNDFISGTYKNIKFAQSDVHVQKKEETTDKDGNKSTYYVTIFRGRLMVFNFNKNFKYNLKVSRGRYVGYNEHVVKMEDEEFNKMFTVVAQSDIEAFYILTPHFMKRIKDIQNKMKGSINFTFTNNKLYVAVNNGEDSFEWSMYREIDDKEVEKQLISEIKLITDFVDELDLENDLFK